MGTPAPNRFRTGLLPVVFAAYLLCLFAVAVHFGLQNVREQFGYNIGDWLINYSGGLIRRGLTGEAILFLSRVSHIQPSWTVFAVQLALFAVLYMAVWLLVQRLQWHAWTILLAFSPGTLGFVALVGGGAFRKELLFLIALATLLLLLQRGVSDGTVVIFLMAAGAFLALSHEGLSVYWPYMLTAVAISRRSLRASVKIGWAPTLLLAAITIVMGRYPGNLDQAKAICASIGSVYAGRDVGLCGGSIAFLAESSAYYRSQVLQALQFNHYLRDYSLLALLAFLPCFLAVKQMHRLPGARQPIRLLLLWGTTALLCSIPLFVFAIDWGRWLYVDIFSWMLLLFFLSAEVQPVNACAEPTHKVRSRSPFVGIAVVLYLITWHIPVTGYEGRGWGYLGMAERHLQRFLHHPPGLSAFRNPGGGSTGWRPLLVLSH